MEPNKWICTRPWLGVEVEKYHRDFAIDRGSGVEMVRWSARRKSRPKVVGYGMTAGEAIFDLTFNVQSLH